MLSSQITTNQNFIIRTNPSNSSRMDTILHSLLNSSSLLPAEREFILNWQQNALQILNHPNEKNLKKAVLIAELLCDCLTQATVRNEEEFGAYFDQIEAILQTLVPNSEEFLQKFQTFGAEEKICKNLKQMTIQNAEQLSNEINTRTQIAARNVLDQYSITQEERSNLSSTIDHLFQQTAPFMREASALSRQANSLESKQQRVIQKIQSLSTECHQTLLRCKEMLQ